MCKTRANKREANLNTSNSNPKKRRDDKTPKTRRKRLAQKRPSPQSVPNPKWIPYLIDDDAFIQCHISMVKIKEGCHHKPKTGFR